MRIHGDPEREGREGVAEGAPYAEDDRGRRQDVHKAADTGPWVVEECSQEDDAAVAGDARGVRRASHPLQVAEHRVQQPGCGDGDMQRGQGRTPESEKTPA